MPDVSLSASRSLTVEYLRSPSGWRGPSEIQIDPSGTITAITDLADDANPQIRGFVVPAIPNLHSHAFQRAMAGHAESRAADRPNDSFWTWREAMYDVAATLDVDATEAIAEWLYIEMLESGSTSVAEFHYVHHEVAGTRARPKSAYSQAILRAAARAGIAVTLLPVLYLHGGFGADLEEHQRRFGHDSVDDFVDLFDEIRSVVDARRHARLGVAFHSLRAVNPGEMHATLERLRDPAAVHLHIAEQQREVSECVRATGFRPLRLLLNEQLVDARTCLVHATHLEPDEVEEAAATGAIAGLCPTTEANLGDGTFRLGEWLRAGGRIGIGSDSHISVDPLEELRLLEYGQRLVFERRTVAVEDSANHHVGDFLWDACARGGATAVGQDIGTLEPGQRADFVVLDAAHPRLLGHTAATVCDAAVFSQSGEKPVREVWVAGERVVEDGRHVRRAEVLERFREVLARLRD